MILDPKEHISVYVTYWLVFMMMMIALIFFVSIARVTVKAINEISFGDGM